ncbi:MAG: deoxyribodipyrimidine photo-lyase [Thalassobaculaceae bacterium]|nr:deoxyribodipyrimidine photo-lyase [Thalassobaculaceae bacterium]
MPDTAAPTLLWFRRDLRLHDNPALTAAAARGGPVIAMFILDDADAGDRRPGGASRWWLHHSLARLGETLARIGTRLVLRRGRAEYVLSRLVEETGAAAVCWNRRYEPWATARDGRIKDGLRKRGLEVQSFNASLLYEPWEVTSKQGTPLKVFSPFWRAVQAKGDPADPLPVPTRLPAPDTAPDSDSLDDWALLPTAPDWAGGLRETWTPGEAGALARLDRFLDEAVGGYKAKRDIPGTAATSALSPHLHFGEISPRFIWHAARAASEARSNEPMDRGTASFLSEICWREFSHNLLFHNPDLPELSLRRAFEDFPWREDIEGLRAWQRGLTGYPIVDAGMRELWQTGWMHNRVRMIAASFLIKDLLVHWRHGAAWFWDTLVDADLASNSASWQWVAGCGADAAPYFRIFNPVLQGEKFDGDATYVRRWVPEIAALPDSVIHKPWMAKPLALAEAGIALGRTYPYPIVDHATARNRALEALKSIKKG